MGIEFLSFHLFSSENWRRPEGEVGVIMDTFERIVSRLDNELRATDVRIRWAGQRTRLPLGLAQALETAEARTSKNHDLTITLCIDYGGRTELVHTANRLATAMIEGHVQSDDVVEGIFRRYLDEHELPDVDLYIRPGGEQRISNFMPWHMAYGICGNGIS